MSAGNAADTVAAPYSSFFSSLFFSFLLFSSVVLIAVSGEIDAVDDRVAALFRAYGRVEQSLLETLIYGGVVTVWRIELELIAYLRI